MPVLYSSPPEGLRKDVQEAAAGVCQEKVPEEQIIYIDDDMDPSPLRLLKRQVDSLQCHPQQILPPRPRRPTDP